MDGFGVFFVSLKRIKKYTNKGVSFDLIILLKIIMNESTDFL